MSHVVVSNPKQLYHIRPTKFLKITKVFFPRIIKDRSACKIMDLQNCTWKEDQLITNSHDAKESKIHVYRLSNVFEYCELV